MPASQLKRLKASLREQGITGPQKSKKQKNAQRSRPSSEKIERSAALEKIRDSFNPFELRQAPRPVKFASVSSKPANGTTGRYKDVLHRPGVARSAGEEMRRATLLPEVQRRNRVGGVVDRRIGEGDVDMTPEEKAAQRFVRAQQKRKGAALFDLENSDNEDAGGALLTHGGRNVAELQADDFKDDVSDASDADDLLSRKRARFDDDGNDDPDGNDQEPNRKKSKKEIMEEVIAKSKFHKYERQKAKEDDEDLREELDKGTEDIIALLNGRPPTKTALPAPETSSNGPVMNPDRQRLLDGMDRDTADKEYDTRFRQLAQDTRAKPSERTKTEEEKAAEEAQRLKELEDKRTKRMNGEVVSDDEEDIGQQEADADARDDGEDEDIVDEAEAFGLATQEHVKKSNKDKIVLDEEDDFALDEDLVASGSDVELSESDEDSSIDDSDDAEITDDEEDEFVQDILGDKKSTSEQSSKAAVQSIGLAFTYPCPRSHEELLQVITPTSIEELPTVIKRIRALYHPSLSASNKESMADFAESLVDHLVWMGNEKQSLTVAEQVIRHLHSLSRTYPVEIATAFRKNLQKFYERDSIEAGDLLILTAIGSIYPTSDQFHPVVTPAMTLIARYIGLHRATTQEMHTIGALLIKLALQYQRLSKRYIPEAVRYTYQAFSKPSSLSATNRTAHLENLITMAELWRDKTAFIQIFDPFVPLLTKMTAKGELQTLKILLRAARLRLRPLELHHHKPLAIRTSIPKFEEGFNPDKHYDPDKERSESKKLQKEYKRERKGALRELRKDANFLAREQLREKKERDAAYDKKYKRLIAEIQGQEGHEAKEYEREKKARKRAKK